MAERVGVVERELRVADRRVAARFAGGELAGALLPALAHRADSGGGRGVVDATIAVWEARACPDGPVAFPWRAEDIGPGGLVRGSDRDGVVAVHETGSGALTLAHTGERSLLHRVPRLDAVPWWERAAPLRVALFWALRGDRRHLVHAGAVGDDRGGVLLAGASRSGKTTVALAALTHGLHYLADDYIVLDTHHHPTAHAIYTTAKLDDRHLELFAELAPLVRSPPPSAAGQKSVLDVAVVMPGAVRASLPVRAVIAPRIRGGRTDLAPLKPTQALLALAPSTVFQMPFDDGAALGSLTTLVRRVPCFSLAVGDDPADLADAVDHALDQATR